MDLDEVDVKPFPIGGQNALFKFLEEQLRYPENARNRGIQGRVFVRFLVTTEGETAAIEVVKGVNPEIDTEAARVIKEFGEQIGWEPVLYNGKPVAVQLIFPLLFKL